MKRNLAIIGTITLVLLVLVLINAASYVRIEPAADTEFSPNRSTYNAGPTGLRALYELLQETNRRPARWREPPAALLKRSEAARATFIIAGQTRRPFSREDMQSLRTWVARGGQLVIIDRTPADELLPPLERWTLWPRIDDWPAPALQGDNLQEMVEGVEPLAPVQPTWLTRDLGQVAPTRYAARFRLDVKKEAAPTSGSLQPQTTPATKDDLEQTAPSPDATGRAPAPVAHVADARGALLVDYRYGAGRVVLLGDPFIAANNGIARADNLQLALNMVARSDGPILFDEYH